MLRRLRAVKGSVLKGTALKVERTSQGLHRARRYFLNGSTVQTIHYVVDAPGWVQAKRLKHLSEHLTNLRFKALIGSEFSKLWNRGRLKGEPVYFVSWRVLEACAKQGRCRFGPDDYDRFMAGVTSHQSIGGGLKAATTFPPGRDPDKVLESAVQLLRRLGAVTVNSRILYDLLSSHVPGLSYTPNGVDEKFFHPSTSHRYDRGSIRVGWAGKIRAAKNYETAKAALDRLKDQGFVPRLIAHPKRTREEQILSNTEMRSFYHGIDFFLCTSWHEGTPNPALEAAACGVPVVTTRVGNMPDLIRHEENGFFVEPDVDSIVSTFQRLRELDPGDYASLGRNIRRRIEEDWTWEKNVSNYRTAFRKLLAVDVGASR